MKILYFDCFAGISGDMTLGALIDLGVNPKKIQEELIKINISGYRMDISKKSSYGIEATRVNIEVTEEQPTRHLSDILNIINTSNLTKQVKELGIKIFNKLAAAEAKVHGTPIEHVHFHEVGAVDSIIDIMGSVIALKELDIDYIQSSPLPVGSGYVKCRHGLLPVPAPAVAELLKGVPLNNLDVKGELVTPTGAALITGFVNKFVRHIPNITVKSIGYGMGSNDFGFPNLLRVFLGESIDDNQDLHSSIIILETAVDDLNNEFLPYIMERLFSAGALDVYFKQIIMKKGRPGTLITVLCSENQKDNLINILFTESSTLGIRIKKEYRIETHRKLIKVETPYGKVQVKIAYRAPNKQPCQISPEYEDCRKISLKKNIPLAEVYYAAISAAKKEYLT
ncbi:nickel pincer cofactor biosynthesis protein LarC [Desulfolucanica intricata]|uniref:nickel pincer cofactor biosynthesis protein LarC n=1 Tax=Desulfolucanica intricata TaxID=1285191 RepID=UPI00082F4E23|nr:nickel pincer cofactor biosynthesis protein LarC [Desulfolucanica intricata]